MHPLISAAELAALVDSSEPASPRLLDVRWDLASPDAGHEAYLQAHIPGAVFVDLDNDLSNPPGEGGRHPLPSPERFARTLGRLGVARDTHVVVYDDAGGRIAARLWWMLRAVDHESVQLLDGGLTAWRAGGYVIHSGEVEPVPTEYPTPDAFEGTVPRTALSGRSLIDARAGSRYRGDEEPVDPRPGHIPGAVNVSTSANLADDGTFLDPSLLREVYEEFPDDVIVSCGSGVTACHDALAMVVAGRPMPEVYVGSYSEWSRLDLPVNTGPTP